MPKLVEIHWVDSATRKDYWQPGQEVIDDTRKDGLEQIITVGYLMDKTKDYVLICQTLQTNRDGNYPRVAGVLEIPSGCILRIRQIKSLTKKGKK